MGYIASNIYETYDVRGGSATTFDLSKQQVFEIDNPASTTVNFINLPSVNRGKVIIVDVQGAGSINFTFPGYTIFWENGGAENTPPDVGDNWTTWRFIFTGSRIRGGNLKG